MKMEKNGKATSGKMTKHLAFKFFYFTDLIERGKMQVKYCLSDEMTANYMTKLIIGFKFIKFRNHIMDER
jgi:hypothetical protein